MVKQFFIFSLITKLFSKAKSLVDTKKLKIASQLYRMNNLILGVMIYFIYTRTPFQLMAWVLLFILIINLCSNNKSTKEPTE